MNKAFYIVSLVMSVVFLIVCSMYIEEVSDARLDALMSSISSYDSYSSYSSYTSYYDYGADITSEAALICIFFFLLFITTDLLGVIKVKTTTVKVLGIIGLSISGLFLLWDLVMLSSPSGLSFDEVGVAFVLYSFIMIAFSIVGLVQSIKYEKIVKAVATPATGGNSDLLDS